jgi:predicted dehydrogenase
MSDGNLRAGVIGVGIGRMHLDKYRSSTGVDVTALCDLDEKRLHETADEFGIAHRFTDAGDMFRSGTCDLVSVCTPNAYHAPLTIEAVEAGLHVLCEKPMAMNTAEAQSMIDAAERNGKILSIHFNHRMQSHVAALKKYADTGDLGELYFGRTTWHRRRGIPGRPGFVSKKQAGGGAMIDLGVHQLDQLLYVMGHPEIASLSAQVYTKFNKVDVPALNMDVDDFSIAFVRFTNGATAEMEISWASHHHHAEHRVLQIYGTDGGGRRELVDYGGGPNDLTIYRRRHGALTDEQVKRPPDVDSVQQDFVNAIREGRRPLCTAEHGLTTMMILDALYKSSETGQEVIFSEMFQKLEKVAEASGTTPH